MLLLKLLGFALIISEWEPWDLKFMADKFYYLTFELQSLKRKQCLRSLLELKKNILTNKIMQTTQELQAKVNRKDHRIKFLGCILHIHRSYKLFFKTTSNP